MRRRARIIGWVLAFSACFAVGAVIAAHSNPFPPGVVDPGSLGPTTSTPPPPASHVLAGNFRLQTAHTLYVGGACRTNWKGTLSLQQDASGKITGTGTFHLLGGLHCDFAVIQVQTKALPVSATGSVKGGRVILALTATGRDPKASSDFGGLSHTVRYLRLSVPPGQTQQVHAYRSDGDRGGYTSTGTFTLVCHSGC